VVQKARAALLAEGKHPSIDAVRVKLGNTGSKTTISRYLKELEPRMSGMPWNERVSQAVLALAAQWGEQLATEAQATIDDAKASWEASAAALQARLDKAEVALSQARQAGLGLERALAEERDQRALDANHTAALNASLTSARANLQEFSTRLEEKQLAIDLQITQAKHNQDNLEHFRQASEAQRAELVHQHEHQVQQLARQVRSTELTLAGAQQQLIDLNRDNARLVEDLNQRRHTHQQNAKALRDLQQRFERLSREHAQLSGQAQAHSSRVTGLQIALDEKTAECESLKLAAVQRTEMTK
jgi:predicted  nucleic acid-binding Zn-ribbon protein